MSNPNINFNVSGPKQPASIYKTIVLKGDRSFVSQVTEENTKYVIKHNFDLSGGSFVYDGWDIEGMGGNPSIIDGEEYWLTDYESGIAEPTTYNLVDDECFFVIDGHISDAKEVTLQQEENAWIATKRRGYHARILSHLDPNAAITIPANCLLEFDGGSLSNGNIVFDYTILKGDVRCYLSCSGTVVNNEIDIDWFVNDTNPSKFLYELRNFSGFHIVNFTRGKEYNIDTDYMRFNYGIQTSDVEFRGNWCTLKPVDTHNMATSIVHLQSCTNIKFKEFNIHDIVELETTSLGTRHAMNIVICNNIEICNVNFTECAADGIRMEGNNRVVVDNVSINRYGRNGISLINGQNILITNSIIKNHVISENIPNEAHCCIDVEPNGDNIYLKNIRICNNKFYDAIIHIYSKNTLLDEMDIAIFDNSLSGAQFICSWHQLSNSKGNVVFKNNTLQEYDNNAILIQTSSLTNIYTHLINNIIHNVCKDSGSVLESKCAILIADRGSSKIDTNIGNVYINGLTIIQDSVYASKMPIIVGGYPYNDNLIENVYIKNVKTFGCVFAYNTYDTIYSRIPVENIDESAVSDIVVSNSITDSINISNKYIIDMVTECSFKNTLRPWFDTITIVNKNGTGVVKVKNLFASNISAYYFNGSAVQLNDIIQSTRTITIIKISNDRCIVHFICGEVIRDNKVVLASYYKETYSNPNFPQNYNGANMRGDMAFNYTVEKPYWLNSSGLWVDANSVIMGTRISGTWAQRPTIADNNIYVGFKYFCTDKQTAEGATDGIEIIHKGNNVWVDALGRVVS